MVVRPSRYFNDENVGRAFENIAQMFAPPESGDMANYALAKERRQKTDIIDRLAADPRYAGFDRQAILADLFDPTASFEKVYMDDATSRRGQDVAASTSRANNDADNERFIATNAADNQRALATNAADNSRALALPRFSPLAPGDILPPVDPALSSMFDLPPLDSVAGPAKPMSETEVKGAERQRLLNSGQITDADLVATILGDIPVENVVGADNKPVIARRNDAVGMEPAYNPSAGTTVNLPAGETSYDKSLGEGLAKSFLGYQAEAEAGRRALASMDIMSQSLSDPAFYSGVGSDQVLTLKRMAATLGFDPDGVASMESFNSAAKQAALDSLGGSLGTGFSNADRDFVLEQVPNLSNSPEGNRALIEIQRKLNERKIQIAEVAQRYSVEHGGRIDGNFGAHLNRWAEQNPLFPSVGGLPPGVTEEDIAYTMQRHNLTREQVLGRLK